MSNTQRTTVSKLIDLCDWLLPKFLLAGLIVGLVMTFNDMMARDARHLCDNDPTADVRVCDQAARAGR